MTDYISVQTDKTELGLKAAEYWLGQYEQAVKNRAVFHVVLSGGTTPKLLYEHLASKGFADRVNWKQVHVYFGDERFVPHDHADSNYRMAKETLLDKIDIPIENIHPVEYRENHIEDCARAYQQTIETNVKSWVNDIPQFDLVLLGMGDDGHTASLFPDTEILNENQRWVSEVFVKKFNSWRVSMTYPLINNARNVCILVVGDNKAEVMLSVLARSGATKYPILRIRPIGDLVWILDASAATLVIKQGIPSNLSKLT